jgi:cholesterol oxidase
VFDGYGHQDVFMGKDVASDIFPRFLDFFGKYRSDAIGSPVSRTWSGMTVLQPT